MASRQCILAMEQEDIEREKFDGLIAKCQIRQYFPPSINYAIQYINIKCNLINMYKCNYIYCIIPLLYVM